jgi:hypothetical protein
MYAVKCSLHQPDVLARRESVCVGGLTIVCVVCWRFHSQPYFKAEQTAHDRQAKVHVRCAEVTSFLIRCTHHMYKQQKLSSHCRNSCIYVK